MMKSCTEPSEIVPKASSERSRKTKNISISELIGLSVFVSRISGRYKKKKKKVRALSRGCSVSRRRAMMMKNKVVLRSFRRRRRNDRGRQRVPQSDSELIGLSVFVSRMSERYKKKKKKVRARSRGCSVSRRRAMMMKNKDKS